MLLHADEPSNGAIMHVFVHRSPNEVMEQMAAHLLGEVPVLASERGRHRVGVAHVLQPEPVREVERKRRREGLGDVGPVVLVEAEGEGDAAAAPGAARAFGLLVGVRQCNAVVVVVLRGHPATVVREAHLSRHVVGHRGELALDVPMCGVGAAVLRHAAALPLVRVRRIGGPPAAVRRMLLGLLLHAELILVGGRALVPLPHLQVVDFFHHWLPESNPCVYEPV